MAEHLVLVGMMGAGKSTVGRLLARRLGRPYVDTDRVIEKEAGMSVAPLFVSRGEDAFRAEESRVLADVLHAAEPSVVSLGGGAVLDRDNRERLRASSAVVWLRARPDTLARRVGRGVSRPLLARDDGADTAAVLARIDEERRPLYEEVANAVVDVDDLSPEAVADQVVAAVHVAAVTPGSASRLSPGDRP